MRISPELKISVKHFIFIISVFVFSFLLIPPYFLRFNFINLLDSALMVGLLLVLLTLNFILIKRINMFIILSVAFVLWRFIASYYLAGSITDLNNLVKILNIVLFINIAARYFPKEFLNAGSFVASVYLLLNFATLILFPNGIYLDIPRINHIRPGWVYGIGNNFAYYIIPSLALIMVNSFYRKMKITSHAIVMLAISVFSLYISESATGLIIIILYVVLIFIYKFRLTQKVITFSSLTIFYIILLFIIIRINTISIFQYIIVDILEKDLTFTGRTRIWDAAVDYLADSLIYGYGINHRILVGHTYFVSHNQFMQLTLESGVIGLILFISLIIYAGSILRKYRGEPISYILLISGFTIFLGGLMEAYQYNNLFLFLSLISVLPWLGKRNGDYIEYPKLKK